MLDIFQIQPCPVAFSRFGCEAYIGDRVQGEQKPYLAISVCSGPFQSRCKSMIIIIWPFQFYIGESGVLPFLLLLPLLMVSGHLHLPSLRFSTMKKIHIWPRTFPFLIPCFMCDPFQVDLPAYSCAYAVWCWSSQSGVAHKVGLLLRCLSASRILWFFWKWKPMANLSGVYIWAASCSSVSLSISSASSSATSSLSTSSTASFKICFAFCWCHR